MRSLTSSIAPFSLLVLIVAGPWVIAAPKERAREIDAPGVSRIISVEETEKLKAIRDEIGEIKGLEELYQDRTHENGLPFHVYVPEALEPGVNYPMVTFLHGHSMPLAIQFIRTPLPSPVSIDG